MSFEFLKVAPAAAALLFAAPASVVANPPAENHEAEISALIAQMTLHEKLDMIHASSAFNSGGVPRLGIPELVMSDGPHGVRYERSRDWKFDSDSNFRGTYLPVGVCLASTWDPDAALAFGKVLGSEARYRGKDVILGPAINIQRTPLGGRNFEYMSEDPYLVSQMVVPYIDGVQQNDVAACVKHYIANNQEVNRHSVDVQMSDRALREIYMPGFKAAVDGGVWTLMGSYNMFRGQFATHNAFLMNDVLKGEWGFEGAVISDWSAVADGLQALTNGTDIEMGRDVVKDGHILYDQFPIAAAAPKALEEGKVTMDQIDDKVRRILRVMFWTHKLGDQRREVGVMNTRQHQETARHIAEEGIVLLKNDRAALPAEPAQVKSILVVGANADTKFAAGGGSSQVPALYEVTALEGIKALYGKAGVQVDYARGYSSEKDSKADPKLIGEAVDAAKTHDLVIYVGGYIHTYSKDPSVWDEAYDAEGKDKPDMMLPFAQDELIGALSAANPKTVVVLYGGGPVDMRAWVDKVPAIVQAWYPGMEGGNALAEILSGDVNPSGRLPVTFPKKLGDASAHALGEYPGGKEETYKEDIFVGYRYAETFDVAPQFAFGHGLSYTTFAYGPLQVTQGKDGISVTTTITNTGKRAGAEVAQLYVGMDAAQRKALDRPVRELKGFQRVFLKPGESREVTFTLPRHAFAIWEDGKGWTVPAATYTLSAGAASDDLRQSATYKLGE